MQKIILSILLMTIFSQTILAQSTFHQNKIIAHRGAWKANGLPQNSIASLREAVRGGC